MLLFWRIRYLDTCEKQFKDRDLWLDTDTLDNVTKSAVELTYELKDTRRQREMLRYRHFFQEKNCAKDELNLLFQQYNGSVDIHEYYEDENGNELSNKQMAVILTGNPDVIMFPVGAKQYHIDYALSKKRPISIEQISLSQKQLEILGYFVRDLREMLISAFYKDGPGTLKSTGGNAPNLYTAVTDEEIRSFVTIFRRLYMKTEPANFLEAVAVFEEAVREYSLGDWVKGVRSEYEVELNKRPRYIPFLGQFPFTRKRLIDIFLYTQYAHQPDARRSRQFQKCLSAMNNNRPVLTWLFLTELHACSLHMLNAGRIIAGFYDRYRQYHKVSSNVLASVASVNPGIGILEKKEAREARIFREKSEELAKTIWMDSGCPVGGHMQFINQASEQIKQAVTDKIKGDKWGEDRE